jgi:hypothetical protein
MPKDSRYKTVKFLIEGGHVTEFRYIFEHIPKTVVAKDMGTNYKRLVRLAKDVNDFKVKELTILAFYFDVNFIAICKLIDQQMTNEKKRRAKK